MATTKHRSGTRPPFDPSRDFVTCRSLPVSGVVFDSGDPFDKTLVSERRLRQLYDTLAIRVDEDSSVHDTFYVCRPGVKVAGEKFAIGAEFDRGLVSPARFIQMVDQGYLTDVAPRKKKKPRRVRRTERVRRAA